MKKPEAANSSSSKAAGMVSQPCGREPVPLRALSLVNLIDSTVELTRKLTAESGADLPPFLPALCLPLTQGALHAAERNYYSTGCLSVET